MIKRDLPQIEHALKKKKCKCRRSVPLEETSVKDKHIERLQAKLKAKRISEFNYVTNLSIYTKSLHVGLNE